MPHRHAGGRKCFSSTSWAIIIDAAAFLRGLDEPERLPDRSALLTFDDGYRSMRAVALRPRAPNSAQSRLLAPDPWSPAMPSISPA